MGIAELINKEKKTAFSFEVLPPLKGTGIEKLYATIDTLREFDPLYVNITTHRSEYVYRELGGGLYERNRYRRRPGTVAVAAAIHNKYDITVVPHILCSGFSREDTEYILLDLQFLGITNLLVLRGDKAKDESSFVPEKNGYAHALELEEQINAFNEGKFIDGHGPGITGKELNAYAAARIAADHECSTVEEMNDRLERGMYILLRQGSACHNLRTLIKGMTAENSRRCLLCSDDRQPKTILHEGHLDNHLRICVEEGLDPVTAIRMATLNAAECFDLKDRGAIAPGYRGDVVLLDDLKDFHVNRVFVEGTLVAEEGKYLPEIKKCDISSVKGSVIVKDFSKEKFKMNLKSNKVNVIKILPGGVVTAKDTAEIELDANGEFVRNPGVDLVKVAVVERHQGTGNVACGFLKGYGIKEGAVALSVAHDSHNIIVVGVNDEEMEFAVNSLIEQEGGIVLVKEGKVIESMPMPIAGLMSDQSGEWVDQKLTDIHEKAYEELGICGDVEPVMTLCFMSLAVIPEIKLTDMGLFDVTTFSFIPVEVE